ncbi:MAG: hypothetical protein JKX76_00150 [Colwellia sp.]|nr:hypothetical protein [Colwellia sp.]
MKHTTDEPNNEINHQWQTLEEKRLSMGVGKSHLSKLVEREASYYYQSEKFKRPIPLDILSTWAKELELPVSQLFIEGEGNPRAKIMSLIDSVDDEKLPQALRVLEAVLAGQ